MFDTFLVHKMFRLCWWLERQPRNCDTIIIIIIIWAEWKQFIEKCRRKLSFEANVLLFMTLNVSHCHWNSHGENQFQSIFFQITSDVRNIMFQIGSSTLVVRFFNWAAQFFTCSYEYYILLGFGRNFLDSKVNRRTLPTVEPYHSSNFTVSSHFYCRFTFYRSEFDLFMLRICLFILLL